MAPKFENFNEFFPYYLAEHADPICRTLHYIGTTLSVFLVVYAFYSMNLWLLLLYPVVGYGFAWAGHYGFEKNRPATFDYTWWSFLGDLKMYKLWITGQLGPAMADALDQYGRRNSKATDISL